MKGVCQTAFLFLASFLCVSGLVHGLDIGGVTTDFEQGNQAHVHAENALRDARKAGGAEKETLIQKGRSELEKALGCYQSCLQKAESAALHFNMGNTYFKLGQAGRAIFHYRRAQELDPGSEEVRANLAFVRSAAGLPEGESSLYDRTLGRRSTGFWKWMLAGGWWMGLGLLIFPRMYRASGPSFPIIGVVILLFSAVPLWAILQAGKAASQAIILEADTPLLVSPSQGSAVSGYLQGGESVTLNPGKPQPKHLFVSTGSGEEGWVPRGSLGRIRD